jgi:uncharacterized protein (DUF362 family)
MERVGIARVERGYIHSAVHEAIDLIGGIGRYVQPGDRVMVKPNLVDALDWRSGAITNPWVTEAVVEMARGVGASEVIIGEGPTIGLDVQKVFAATGYRDLAARLGVGLVDLNSAHKVLIEVPKGVALKSVHVARLALEVDVVINVPVMKTHNQTTVTLCLKNMKGVLAPEGKRKNHFVGLDQAIADMNTILKHTLIVIDGIIGQERNGPVVGDPVELGLVLSAGNPVAADATAARVMGFDPACIEHIALAAAHGLGPLEDIEVLGEPIESVRRPFIPAPVDLGDNYPGVTVVDRNACSGCWGSLVSTLERMLKSGELAAVYQHYGPLKFSMGKNAEPASDGNRWILYGLCQRKYRNCGLYVPGCPPEPLVTRDQLRALVGLPPLSSVSTKFIEEEQTIIENGPDTDNR